VIASGAESMETFWENVQSILSLLIKALFFLVLLDLGCIFFEADTRIPFVTVITDWILSKVSVLR
jgi:hypothetical protein